MISGIVVISIDTPKTPRTWVCITGTEGRIQDGKLVLTGPHKSNLEKITTDGKFKLCGCENRVPHGNMTGDFTLWIYEDGSLVFSGEPIPLMDFLEGIPHQILG